MHKLLPPLHPHPPGPLAGARTGCEDRVLCRESCLLSRPPKVLSPPPRVPSTPTPARAGPYRTSELRRLPAGPPETRAPPGFVRHGCVGGGGPGGVGDNGYPDWGRRQWPPGLRQLLHPAAQTAEMEIGGGGRERRRRGRGARSRGGGEELERESWERGDGGGAAGEGGERAQSPEPGRVSGGSVTGAVGHGGGPPFLTLCQLPPSPDVLAQTCPPLPPNPPASSRGHSRKHSLAQQSKATGFSYFPLDKGSAEPGKRGLQRGWSEGQSGRGIPAHLPLTYTHIIWCPQDTPSFVLFS